MKALTDLSKKDIDILKAEGYIKNPEQVVKDGTLVCGEQSYTVLFETSEQQTKAYERIFKEPVIAVDTEPKPIIRPHTTIKFYNDETIIIDSALNFDNLLKFALNHNFNVCYTDTKCTKAFEDIAELQSKGYHIKIKRIKNMTPDKQFELSPDIIVFATKHPIITVKEYNDKYVGEITRASLCCNWEQIDNTLHKCNDHDGAIEQLQNGLGWGPEVSEIVNTALEHYKAYLYNCFPK